MLCLSEGLNLLFSSVCIKLCRILGLTSSYRSKCHRDILNASLQCQKVNRVDSLHLQESRTVESFSVQTTRDQSPTYIPRTRSLYRQSESSSNRKSKNEKTLRSSSSGPAKNNLSISFLQKSSHSLLQAIHDRVI